LPTETFFSGLSDIADREKRFSPGFRILPIAKNVFLRAFGYCRSRKTFFSGLSDIADREKRFSPGFPIFRRSKMGRIQA
jgi:hypothetical protein